MQKKHFLNSNPKVLNLKMAVDNLTIYLNRIRHHL